MLVYLILQPHTPKKHQKKKWNEIKPRCFAARVAQSPLWTSTLRSVSTRCRRRMWRNLKTKRSRASSFGNNTVGSTTKRRYQKKCKKENEGWDTVRDSCKSWEKKPINFVERERERNKSIATTEKLINLQYRESMCIETNRSNKNFKRKKAYARFYLSSVDTW